MDRELVVSATVVFAVAAALVAQRRRAAPPTQGRWPVPTQLDRGDFHRRDAAWLVAVFTSATCETCRDAVAKAAVLDGPAVAVEEVEVSARGDLHRRYGVEAVPLVVVADAAGVVRASFVGPPSATDLWAAVAEARQPGSSPEAGLGQPGAASL